MTVVVCRRNDAAGREDAEREGASGWGKAEEEEQRGPDTMATGAVRQPLNSAETGSVFCDEDTKEIVDDMLSLS